MSEPDNDGNKQPEITREILGSKSEFKTLYRTFIQSIRNTKVVVDDYYSGAKNYSKPVKYGLTLIAPYVLITQLLGIQHFNRGYDGTLTEETTVLQDSPPIDSFFANLDKVNLGMGNVIDELEPLFYAIILVPTLAFWTKKFFQEHDKKFVYYYALSMYVIITITTILYPLDIFSYYFGELDYVYYGIYIPFIIYQFQNAFNKNLVSTLFKSVIIMLLTLISIVLVLVIIGFVISLFLTIT